jgi:SPP1 family predicted phage head-tail adaptor
MPIRFTRSGEPYLDPARMNAQITFLEPVTGADASGTTVTAQVGNPPDTAWAEVLPVRGTDVIKAGQDVSKTYVTATVNYRPDNPRSAQDKFQDSRGFVYVIQSVQDLVPGMLKYQVLTSELIGANG